MAPLRSFMIFEITRRTGPAETPSHELQELPAQASTTQSITENEPLADDADEAIIPSVEIAEQGGYHADRARRSQLRRTVSARSRYFPVYDRLFALVLLANIAGLIYLLATYWRNKLLPLEAAITASAVNVLVAILARQDYIVNAVYGLVWRVPHWLPLRLRASLVRVYEHGGVHAGCAIAGTGWFVVFTELATIEFAYGRMSSVPVLAISYTLILLLLTIIVFAYQALRTKIHDIFELTHRFAGWMAVLLFWVDLLVVTHASISPDPNNAEYVDMWVALIRGPAFWLLLTATIHLILPWLRLHRIHFRPTVLGRAAALRLDFNGTWPRIAGIQLSLSPLREWHPFATFPAPAQVDENGKKQQCTSIIIAPAGDWTKAQIAAPQNTYWVRGWARAGLIKLALAFSRVVIVTTGSGIGPALSLLLADEPLNADETDNNSDGTVCRWSALAHTSCRLIWSASAPREIFGEEIYAAVMRADSRAMVLDSKVSGRQDLLAIAYAVWKAERAEAVFVVSNPGTTRDVVHGLEEMGVHAFGPIWDS